VSRLRKLYKIVSQLMVVGMLAVPLLGFKGEDLVFEDYVYNERYDQPSNPSGVGTWQGTGTAWTRLALSFMLPYGGSNYTSATDNYANSGTAVSSNATGTVIEPYGSTGRRLRQSIWVIPRGGSSASFNMRVTGDVLSDGINSGTVFTKGKSFVENLITESGNAGALREYMASDNRTVWINTIMSARTDSSGTNYHGVFVTGKSYSDGAGAFTVPERSYYNYNSWAYPMRNMRANELESMRTAMFDISVSLPKIPQLDNTAPTVAISANPTSWTNGNVTLTGTATDEGSGVKRIQDPGGTWYSVSSRTYTVSANGTYSFSAEDNAGNIGSKAFTVSNIDKAIPTGTISGNPTAWQNTNATLSFSASDTGGSGVKRVRVAGGTWVNGASTSLTATGNGTYSFEVEDNAGNVRTVSETVSKIDKVAPTAPVINVSRTGWGSTDVTFTVTGGSDALSGLASRQYKIGKGAWTGYSTPVTISSSGITQVYARTVDNAGNVSYEVAVEVKKDAIRPTVSASDTDYNWSNADRSIKLNYGDTGGSGLSVSEYAVSDSTTAPTSGWSNYSNAIQLNDNGQYYIHYRARDNAGNETVGYFGPYQIDRTRPTVDVYNTDYTWSRFGRSIILGFSDVGGSGIFKQAYAITDSPVVPTSGWSNYSSPIILSTSGQYYIHYRAVDVAGNRRVGYIGPYRIDTEAPTVEFSGDNFVWRSRADVVITVSDAGGSGLDPNKVKYQWSTSSTIPSTWLDLPGDGKVSQVEDGRWYLHVKASDNAGNETVRYSLGYYVDTMAPKGNYSVDYNPHTTNLTIKPISVTDLRYNGVASGIKEIRVTVTAETAGGNESKTQTIASGFNSQFTFNGRSIHETFSGKANKITVHLEIEDRAGNINNGLQDKEAMVYYSNSAVTKSADGMIVNAGSMVQGGDMLMVYVEAFGNPDSIEVRGYKVGDPSQPLKNFEYAVSNDGNVNVVTDPARKTTVYSEILSSGKPVFVDMYQEPGVYNIEIKTTKDGVVRTQTHVVNVDTEPIITEIRTRLHYKMPERKR